MTTKYMAWFAFTNRNAVTAPSRSPSRTERGRRVMLFTGATAGVKAGPRSVAFGPGKFAQRGLAQSLARDLGPGESTCIVAKGFFLNHPDIDAKIPSALRECVPLVASGAIRVPVAATYPLSALREAVLHAQRGGKVVLDVAGAA